MPSRSHFSQVLSGRPLLFTVPFFPLPSTLQDAACSVRWPWSRVEVRHQVSRCPQTQPQRPSHLKHPARSSSHLRKSDPCGSLHPSARSACAYSCAALRRLWRRRGSSTPRSHHWENGRPLQVQVFLLDDSSAETARIADAAAARWRTQHIEVRPPPRALLAQLNSTAPAGRHASPRPIVVATLPCSRCCAPPSAV